ncbi:hypothetical protein NDU88_000814 [Pleurodeles waltl]|uniref:Uncharacterized protein n=1 Tax=Pleurodeles waltl TaxID=8319 RepID=A0AAV7UUF8_PLEWA|nr:hypothetical protein NDU88_000814 [Pleurodeles waltl]
MGATRRLAVLQSELTRTGKAENRPGAEPEAETGAMCLWPFAPAPRQYSARLEAMEPLLGAIMAAISDLKPTLEPKLNEVTADVSLLRADLQKMTDKVSTWNQAYRHSGRPPRA